MLFRGVESISRRAALRPIGGPRPQRPLSPSVFCGTQASPTFCVHVRRCFSNSQKDGSSPTPRLEPTQEWNDKRSNMSEAMWEYVNRVGIRESPALVHCRRNTLKQLEGRSINMISPDEGQLIQFMVRAVGVRKAIEIGVFAGYSSLCIAEAMPEDGRLIALDVNEQVTRLAREHWEMAGVAHKIDLRLGNAAHTLAQLLEDPDNHGAFDLVFIDADKSGYLTYYEQALKLVRSGGLILIDNVFWHGRVVNLENQENSTLAIRQINELVHGDERVHIAMVPVADGLTMCLKR